MKNKVSLFFLVLIVFITCACSEKVDVEADIITVKGLLNSFNQAFKNEDIELLSECFAHNDDLVVFGTDKAEIFVGWEQTKEAYQKMFDSFAEVSFLMREDVIKVNDTGNSAWASGIYDFEITVNEEIVKLPGMRFTAVFEKLEGKWLIVHFHYSMPVGGQAVEY